MRDFDVEDAGTQELARWLLAREAASTKSAEPDLATALQVCQRLRKPLVAFTGEDGFRALLTRAVTLARAHEPLLAGLRVAADGTFDSLDGAPYEGSEATRAGTRLVATLLGLLATFVGQAVTDRIVRSVWPNGHLDHTLGDQS